MALAGFGYEMPGIVQKKVKSEACKLISERTNEVKRTQRLYSRAGLP